MLSCGLVATWGFYINDRVHSNHRNALPTNNDSAAISRGIADSLQKIYSQTVRSLGAELDSTKNTKGMLRSELDAKMAEIYRLRLEISMILKKENVRKEDLALARQKTIELEMLVADLQGRNLTVETEKQQIAGMLDKVNLQVTELERSNQQLAQENKQMNEKLSVASTFVASDINFSPVMVKNDKEQETTIADKTSKLVISFDVSNNIIESPVAEVYVVILQPDGKLLSDDVWESSALITTNTGNKIRFTRKLRFEYQKGQKKELNFSLNAGSYEKGTYQLQLYHNGYLIGQARKTLG